MSEGREKMEEERREEVRARWERAIAEDFLCKAIINKKIMKVMKRSISRRQGAPHRGLSESVDLAV